jgi:hypothetical protein
MAYVTLAEYRAYMKALTEGIEAAPLAADDTFVTGLLSSAQQFIEDWTNRRFEAATATRYFDSRSVAYSDPQKLFMDDDLLTVTTLTNGDGTVLDSSAYYLETYNLTPKHAIRLKTNYSWTFDTDGRVSVAGTWGYSATANRDVKRITCKLAWLEQQRRFSTGEVTVIDGGSFTYEAAVPKDIAQWLDRHIRRPVA